MLPPQIVFGYHGCDEKVARMVLDGGQLQPSTNDYDWLGHGIYFWESSPARAIRWAQAMARQKGSKIARPAVVGAIINLGHSLNLADPESADLVTFAYDQFIADCEREGIPVPRNKGPESKARFLDCAVMNRLHRFSEADGRQPYDTVRGFFNEGQPVYPTAGLRSLDHVQICIRSTSCIVGFFRPHSAQH